MQLLSDKIYRPEMQENRLAPMDGLHSMEINWYEQKMYFKQFLPSKNCMWNLSPVAQRLSQIMLESIA